MDADPHFVKDIDAKAAQGDKVCQAAAICLQALRSVICNGGCSGSAPAYFSGTVTTLHRHLQQPAGNDADSTTAALMLILRRALPNVSSTAVAARLGHLLEAMTILLKASEKEELVRQALGVLASIADLAFEGLTESSRPNRKILKPVFSFIGDSRPLVRHRAQLAATSVLKRAAAENDQQTLDFASQHLAKMIASARADKKNMDDIPARHAVTLLKAVASLLPTSNMTNLCEALIELPAKLGQHPVSTEAFEFLAGYLSIQDDPQKDVHEEQLKLAGSVLQALMLVQVSVLNVAYVVAYAQAMCSSIAVLSGRAAVEQGKARQILGQKVAAFKQLLGLFAERDPSIQKGLREGSLMVLQTAGAGKDLPFLEKMPEICRPLMRYECKAALPNTLPVIGGIFAAFATMRVDVAPAEIQAWTQSRFEKSRELLSEVIEARDKIKNAEQNVFGKELTQCIGSAITAFGPQAVLSVGDLQLLDHPLSDAGFEQHSRSWLLLVLKDSCKQTSLAFFASKFLPLAMGLKSRVEQAESTSPSTSKKYAILLEQVWALLPGFCNEPIDMHAALMAEGGRLAKYLVSVLQGDAQYRGYVWQGLARLAKVTHEPPTRISEALKESNANCIKTLSTRVMPEMFTSYVKLYSEGEGQDAARVSHSRQLALDTVQSFSRLADPDLLRNLFKSVMQRLLKATVGGDVNPADKASAPPTADLANALVPHLPADQMELVLKVFGPMLNGATGATSDEDKTLGATLQKAAYRAYRSVVQHPAAAKGGEATKVLELWPPLRDSRQTCEVPSLKGRLTAIQALLDLLQFRLASFFNQPAVRQAYLDCLQGALPEIMFHLRDQSTAVREAARDCLHVAATTAIHQELQTEVVTLLSAGLASLTPHSKASAVDALSRLLYEHFHMLSTPLRSRLIQVVLVLLEDRDAQVYRSSLKFAKVVVYVVGKEDLQGYLPQILRLFESKHVASAKMVVRSIVERLIKLLPEGVLAAAFPQAHQPLLHYVQRQLARKQRPQSMKNAGEDDSDEEEDGDADMEDVNGRKKNKKSWEAFRAGDDKEAADDSDDEGTQGKRKKRARDSGNETAGKKEPSTSAVMAHEAMQSLLDAWEAESDDENSARKGKRKRGEVATSTWIHEDADVPIDFMSADAAHSVITSRPAERKRRRGEADGESKVEALRRHGLRFAEDGRLVVDEEAEEMKDEDDAEEIRQKASKFNVGADGELKPLSRLAQMRASRARAKARLRVDRKNSHIVKGLDVFKPGKKKAEGDARRHSSLNPYAYVRLNPKVTKEKFRGKATEALSKVVKGAKKGVLKGAKAKERDAKHRQIKHMQKRSRGKNKRRPTNLR